MAIFERQSTVIIKSKAMEFVLFCFVFLPQRGTVQKGIFQANH